MDKTKANPVVTLITRVQPNELDPSNWLVRLLMTGVPFEGFWSGEIIPPSRNPDGDWLLLQRFRSEAQAIAFRDAAARRELLSERPAITAITEQITTDGSMGNAVTAIVTNVKPSMQDAYWRWAQKIHSAQAKFAEYGGIYVQPPPPHKPGQWTTLVRFDSAQALETWFESPERQALLAEAEQFVDTTRYHQVSSTFPGFFPHDDETGKPTPKWKASLMVLIGLFPILEVLRYFYTPWATEANIRLVLSLALSTAVSVSLVSYVTMPLLVKWFDWWLAPQPNKASASTDLKGLAIVLAVFAVEISIAWNILIK